MSVQKQVARKEEKFICENCFHLCSYRGRKHICKTNLLDVLEKMFKASEQKDTFVYSRDLICARKKKKIEKEEKKVETFDDLHKTKLSINYPDFVKQVEKIAGLKNSNNLKDIKKQKETGFNLKVNASTNNFTQLEIKLPKQIVQTINKKILE